MSTNKIKTPVPKLFTPGHNPETLRLITVGQLAVLLWHLYRAANDPDIGYLDANTDLNRLLARKLNKAIKISKRDLESLLFCSNLAESSGFWWSPDGKGFAQFISPLLFHGEVFDRTWNAIETPKDNRAVRNKHRYIRKTNTKHKEK